MEDWIKPRTSASIVGLTAEIRTDSFLNTYHMNLLALLVSYGCPQIGLFEAEFMCRVEDMKRCSAVQSVPSLPIFKGTYKRRLQVWSVRKRPTGNRRFPPAEKKTGKQFILAATCLAYSSEPEDGARIFIWKRRLLYMSSIMPNNAVHDTLSLSNKRNERRSYTSTPCMSSWSCAQLLN